MIGILTRRNFVKLISLLSSALALSPLRMLKKVSDPSLADEAQTIYAHYGCDSYVLHIENPFESKLPKFTYRQLLQEWGYCDHADELEDEEIIEYAGITRDRLEENSPPELYEEWYWRGYSATKPVFDDLVFMLDEETLGKDLLDRVDWCEGPHPGNDDTWVELQDKEAVKELEQKLNAIGCNYKFKFVEW